MPDVIALFAQIVNPDEFTVGLALILGFAFAFVAVMALALCVGAWFLQLATRIVCGIRLPFWTALLYSFYLGLINLAIGIPIGIGAVVIFGTEAMQQGTGLHVLVQLFSSLVGFVVAGVFYGWIIKDMYGRPIGLGRGFLIAAFLTALGIAIGIAIVGGVLVVVLAAGAFS